MDDPAELWFFLPIGYALTILLETPVLLVGLSPAHSWQRRIFAGCWLTAVTYPIVILVLPILVQSRFADPAVGRIAYLAVAETFAPLAECCLFWFAFYPAAKGDDSAPSPRPNFFQDMATIVAANLFSFLAGGWLVDHFFG